MPLAQLERLRNALASHVRGLMDVVRGEFADAPPGPLNDVVTKAYGLGGKVLSQPVKDSVVDLLTLPPVARLLLLMAEDPEAFGSLSGVSAPVASGRRAGRCCVTTARGR
ncbi:hypothetical protein ACFVXE_08655 [Streptomyces sp. NPDC058231]|uniref:hypothetical protein n=1 Tax=Streptomyces sp. NPDC058231 TaxID=3346392 RepID=UPI0036E4686A